MDGTGGQGLGSEHGVAGCAGLAWAQRDWRREQLGVKW